LIANQALRCERSLGPVWREVGGGKGRSRCTLGEKLGMFQGNEVGMVGKQPRVGCLAMGNGVDTLKFTNPGHQVINTEI
jgi:hypothetical protein